jgi:hypothetical protein
MVVVLVVVVVVVVYLLKWGRALWHILLCVVDRG